MLLHELPSEPLVMKAGASTYVVFGVIFGVMVVASIVLTFQHPSLGSVWSGTAVTLLALILSFVWIASFKLVVANSFISYRTLFTGTRSFALSEIEECEFAIGYEKYWDRYKPPLRLVIQPRQSTGKKPISVNLKVFSESDVLWIMKVLVRNPKG